MKKTTTSQLEGIGKRERVALAHLRRHAQGVIDVRRAAEILNSPRTDTARLLSLLARKGWLTRVKRGVYIPVALESTSPVAFPEDPYVLACNLFHPCYVGGWSAAQHWDLTEQIFRTTLVVTSRPVRTQSFNSIGVDYRVKHCRSHKFFGTTAVWRGAVRVDVSDLEKTIIDMLDDPSTGGGIGHVAEIFRSYWQREDTNYDRLLDYAAQMQNGAVFKRLGFLAEAMVEAEERFLDSCRSKLTAGNAILDPKVERKGRLTKRWRLWVNVQLSDRGNG